jgi:hypothetical protein
MKYFFFFTVVALTATFAGCNNSNAGSVATNNTGAASAADAGAFSGAGNAVFSYSLSGKTISGGAVDATQTNNVGSLTGNEKGKKVQFFLGDDYLPGSEVYAHSLRFAIPGKTGNVTMADGDDNWSVQLFVGTADEKYDLYGNETFTVTVSSISSTRVSGTFSGKVKLVMGKGTGTDELVITDGKFDIPMRTEGK